MNRKLLGDEGARLRCRRWEGTDRRMREVRSFRYEGHQESLGDLHHFEHVRDEVAAVKHLPRQGLFDLADRGDLALDDEGAQRHGEGGNPEDAWQGGDLSNTYREVSLEGIHQCRERVGIGLDVDANPMGFGCFPRNGADDRDDDGGERRRRPFP